MSGEGRQTEVRLPEVRLTEVRLKADTTGGGDTTDIGSVRLQPDGWRQQPGRIALVALFLVLSMLMPSSNRVPNHAR